MTREEAINLVKQVLPCLNIDEKIREGFETLIPELRESEDERIRKHLVDMVKRETGFTGFPSQGQVLAYLEKQKERGPLTKDEEYELHRIIEFLKDETCPSEWISLLHDIYCLPYEKHEETSKAIEAVDRIDKYIDEHLANAHDMKDSNPDKKYYQGWDDALGKMAGILQDVYSGEKQKESLRDFIDDFPYSDEQKEPENISASTMIPSFHEELTEFELVLFNAVLDNNFVGAKGSENALAMTKKVTPELLAIAKKELDWDREKCFVCQEYEKGFKQGHLEGCTAGYNKAMKEVDEQKEQKSFNVCEQCECPDYNEQKPTERIDFDNEFENQVSHLLASVLNGEYEYNKDFIKYASQSLLEYAKKEQKHTEWSKEDSLYLTNAILSAEKEWGNESCTAKWLKSLPERLNLQLKQKWSKEDYHWEGLIRLLQNYQRTIDRKSNNMTYEDVECYISWLKSLRPHWKPSEEQMKALLKVVDKARELHYSSNSGYDEYNVLRSLYKQLKEL